MSSTLTTIGIELIVEDLDRAIELFQDVMGLQLISRGPSTLVVGEIAMIDAGPIVISLLAPAASGDGAVLSERSPRVSQLIFGSPDEATSGSAFLRAIAAGLAVSDLSDGRFHVTPESASGALGIPMALVTVPVAAG